MFDIRMFFHQKNPMIFQWQVFTRFVDNPHGPRGAWATSTISAAGTAAGATGGTCTAGGSWRRPRGAKELGSYGVVINDYC